ATQSGDALRPVSLDRGAPFELEAELGEELDGGVEVFHDDADVVHPFDGHGRCAGSGDDGVWASGGSAGEPGPAALGGRGGAERPRRSRARGRTPEPAPHAEVCRAPRPGATPGRRGSRLPGRTTVPDIEVDAPPVRRLPAPDDHV